MWQCDGGGAAGGILHALAADDEPFCGFHVARRGHALEGISGWPHMPRRIRCHRSRSFITIAGPP
jgi:hypothetical protein